MSSECNGLYLLVKIGVNFGCIFWLLRSRLVVGDVHLWIVHVTRLLVVHGASSDFTHRASSDKNILLKVEKPLLQVRKLILFMTAFNSHLLVTKNYFVLHDDTIFNGLCIMMKNAYYSMINCQSYLSNSSWKKTLYFLMEYYINTMLGQKFYTHRML